MTIDLLMDVLEKDKPSKYIRDKESDIFEMIPELEICKGFKQNNIWHVYDVYEHILHVIDLVDNNKVLRMAALFHDIGKPFTYVEDENGIGHFFGHWEKSNEIFLEFCFKYGLEENMKNLISKLILYHDLNVDKITDDLIDELANNLKKDGIIMLFQLKQSDLLAQNSKFHYLLDNYDKKKSEVLSSVINLENN